MDTSFLSLPMGAGPLSRDSGMTDELGNPVYFDAFGQRYTIKTQNPNRESYVRAGLGALDKARKAPLESLTAGAQAIAQGAWDAVSAPGRSWSDTVTYGDVANTAGLVSLPAVAGKYDPLQLNAGPVKAWHGSNTPNIKTLKASEPGTGAMGPGVYFTPAPNLAERYGPNLYEKDLEGFFGGMGRLDSDADINHFQTWRDETARLLDAATDAERPIIEKSLERGLTSGDGYPFFIDIAAGLGSKEAAQDVFRRAGFKGVSGHIDGPEIVMFDDVAMQPRIRAYHGSPHDFDRFDMNKIGTGEGAQAYGHGLYFAESEGVARSYKPNSSEFGTTLINGAEPKTRAERLAANALLQSKMDIRESRSALEKIAGGRWDDGTAVDALKILDDVAQKEITVKEPGHMYEVDINADPADFLDWDAPLSEQPAKVRRGFTEATLGKPDPILSELMDDSGLPNEYLGLFPASSGAQAYNTSSRGVGKLEFTERLKNTGIPGIKYYDQGSRASGQGTRNYVVFDDALIEILRKYGLAGLAPLGATLAGSDQAQY